MKKGLIACFISLSVLIMTGQSHAAFITTSAAGNLMFEYLGGSAGPSLQEFGLGTPDIDSVVSERSMIFTINYRSNFVTPSSIVNMGYFYSGSQLDFYNISDYNGNLYAFSSRIGSSPTLQDQAVFKDTDNSLRLGGSAVEVLGTNAWIFHLDDAWSYMYDDDDNEMLIKVYVDPSAVPPMIPIPEPAAALLFCIGLASVFWVKRFTRGQVNACGCLSLLMKSARKGKTTPFF